MPLPVIAGIPWLAGLLGGLFSAVFGFFAKYLTKRLAIVAAAITAITALTAGFFSMILAAMNGINASLPTDVGILIGHVLPSNFELCVATILSAQSARWVYEWNVKVIQMRLF